MKLPSDRELSRRLIELWESPEVQRAAFPPGRKSYYGVEVPVYMVVSDDGWSLYWGTRIRTTSLVVQAHFPAIADQTVPDPGYIDFRAMAARMIALALGKRMKALGEFAGFSIDKVGIFGVDYDRYNDW